MFIGVVVELTDLAQSSVMNRCAYFVSQPFTRIRGTKIKDAYSIAPNAPDALLK